MAVVVARMIAKLEAETSQFHARMDAASQQFTKMTSTTATTRRAIGQMRGAFESLAFQGLGLLPPAAARAGAAMTAVFVGSPVMLAILGFTAALGALSMAFDQAGKKAEEFVAEANRVREFRQSHVAMLGGIGGPFKMTAAEELAALRDQRALIQKQIEARRPLTESVVAQLGGFDPVAKRASDEIDALTNSLRSLDRQLALMMAEPAMERFNFMLSNLRRPSGFEFTPGGLRRGGFQAPVFGGGGPPELHFLPRDPFAGIATMFGRGNTPSAPKKPGFQFTPEFAIMSSMALLQGAQGGPAGFFGAAAGPVGMINPLAGAITAGIGGIFSLFDNSEERRHKALLDKLDQLGEEVGLERVTVVFTGPDGHQVRKSLAELEESDAVERVPGPVGARG